MEFCSHNFKTLEYAFVTINGEEIGDCCLSEKGCSIGKVTQGNSFGSSDRMREQSRENARRIAACVNYCVSMTTEELEEKFNQQRQGEL